MPRPFFSPCVKVKVGHVSYKTQLSKNIISCNVPSDQAGHIDPTPRFGLFGALMMIRKIIPYRHYSYPHVFINKYIFYLMKYLTMVPCDSLYKFYHFECKILKLKNMLKE